MSCRNVMERVSWFKGARRNDLEFNIHVNESEDLRLSEVLLSFATS